MLNVYLLTVSLIIACVADYASGLTVAQTTQGYFWRDFKGVLPVDALKGGAEYNGQPIYIGQVLYDGKLLPAKILENDPNAYFAWEVEKSQKDNIKILCTQEPQRMQWIATSNDAIPLLTNKYLISGGYDPNFSTYIGRVYHDGETLVGKIKYSLKNPEHTGILVTKGGKSFHYTTYDILSYNSDTPIVEFRFTEDSN